MTISFLNKNSNKKIITVGGVKGGIGKSTISTNIAYLLAKDGKKTILVDTDYRDPNLFQRTKGLIEFDFNRLKESNSRIYFINNAPVQKKARDTLLSWYGKSISWNGNKNKSKLLKELEIPHILLYATTANDPDYERKLSIGDLPVNAGENLQIIYLLLDRGLFPLTQIGAGKIKKILSSISKLDADRIVFDTPPGANDISSHLSSITDVRYIVPKFETSAYDTAINDVEGTLISRVQAELKKYNGVKDTNLKKLIEDAQRMSIYETKAKGLSWIDFFHKHGEKPIVQGVLKDFGDNTFPVINLVPFGYGKQGRKKSAEFIKNVKKDIGVELNTISNARYIFRLDDDIELAATENGVPFAHQLSKLEKLSKTDERCYKQLKNLIGPVR